MRELGTVCSGSPSDTDRIMLKDVQFTIGDMIDVAITPPLTTTNIPYVKNDSLLLDSGRRLLKQNNPDIRNRRSHEEYRECNNKNNADLEPSKYRRHVHNVNSTSQDSRKV
ncbi:unnamed protein product [Schistosoma turkestanicum]|nr:unnamed protein product [Schistosoma turkestanicum]